jgi:hypothetical protein
MVAQLKTNNNPLTCQDVAALVLLHRSTGKARQQQALKIRESVGAILAEALRMQRQRCTLSADLARNRAFTLMAAYNEEMRYDAGSAHFQRFLGENE